MHRSLNLPPRTPEEEFVTPPNQKRVSTIRIRLIRIPCPKTNDQEQENSKANCFHLLQYLSRNNKSKNFIPPQVLPATKKKKKKKKKILEIQENTFFHKRKSRKPVLSNVFKEL